MVKKKKKRESLKKSKKDAESPRRHSVPTAASPQISTSKSKRRVSDPEISRLCISPHVRQKNVLSLEKLNCSLNTNLGIHQSPGTLKKKAKARLSLQERREEMVAKREKLRESFKLAISAPS